MLEKAIKLAKENGYDSAVFDGEWKGFRVYRPVFLDDAPHYLGVPYVILEKNNEFRFSSNSEAMEYQYTFAEQIDEGTKIELLKILS